MPVTLGLRKDTVYVRRNHGCISGRVGPQVTQPRPSTFQRVVGPVPLPYKTTRHSPGNDIPDQPKVEQRKGSWWPSPPRRLTEGGNSELVRHRVEGVNTRPPRGRVASVLDTPIEVYYEYCTSRNTDHRRGRDWTEILVQRLLLSEVLPTTVDVSYILNPCRTGKRTGMEKTNEKVPGARLRKWETGTEG